jgi:type II secretory pathway pseudopilin PulG
MRKLTSKAGFTLVEALLAVTITAVCLSGLLLTYINLLTWTGLWRDFTLATSAMQARMEEIKRADFANLTLYDNTTFNITGFNSTTAMGGTQVMDTGYDDLKEVRLTVSFFSRGRLIGEDRNLNGTLESSEDLNNNSRMDSPCELVTTIANFTQ